MLISGNDFGFSELVASVNEQFSFKACWIGAQVCFSEFGAHIRSDLPVRRHMNGHCSERVGQIQPHRLTLVAQFGILKENGSLAHTVGSGEAGVIGQIKINGFLTERGLDL